MATVDNLLKQKLEHLLGMGGGYVLDYSNASFTDFVRNSIGINPYDLHDGSKALESCAHMGMLSVRGLTTTTGNTARSPGMRLGILLSGHREGWRRESRT